VNFACGVGPVGWAIHGPLTDFKTIVAWMARGQNARPVPIAGTV
jgi:hypothetical protein